MKKMFDQTRIGKMVLKNRLWRSATWMNMADERGHLTDRLEQVYLNLARGGVGTIITGYAFVIQAEQPNAGMLGIYDDSFISKYRAMNDKIHVEGANIIMQIVYGGSCTAFIPNNRLIWGPSPVAHPLYGVIPKEMTKEDIQTVVTAHAEAARRVKTAGFDGVQLHGAHTYLLSQFLSPYFNRRQDEYGGSIENRARIIIDTLAAVREEVGFDYPVFIKMHCSDDWGENGLTVDESLWVAKALEEKGITGIEFSGGNLDVKNYPNAGPIRNGVVKIENQSYFVDKTAAIAQHLSIPVISVGGHRDLKKMEEILNNTPIDYIAMSRTLLSEPDLIRQWERGNVKKPRCVGCNKCRTSDGNVCILDREPS